jgi:SRSO17 transposase
LLPKERNKTVTAIAGAESIVGAQDSDVQQMQFLLSESKWEIEEINQFRLDLLQKNKQSTGDRKWGNETAHVARQYLGYIGKIDQGIVAVSSLWADTNIYYPLHVYPYTPSERLAMGKKMNSSIRSQI